jgi:ribosomal-protein-alanine N-acetyltransferase
MHSEPRPLIAELAGLDRHKLAAFFEILARDAETVRFFHPHPLTQAYAELLCAGVGRRLDRYFLARRTDQIVGYSILRGWDEGYTVPSFGVGIHPRARGTGLGQILFQHAINESRRAGAPALRLTVNKANLRAVHIYRKFGMAFQEKNADEWIGMLELREHFNHEADATAHAADDMRPSTDAR